MGRANVTLAAVFGVILVSRTLCGEELSYYLPQPANHDDSVPTPQAILRYEVGNWHVRHDQIVEYFKALADSSPRVTLMEYGMTHERRPLLLATITSPENHARIEELRERHLAAIGGVERPGEVSPEPPLVVWMGYSVHGNESSGANASLIFAYHLAAAQDDSVCRALENTIILIDPAINPDGLSRFAQWANSHKSKHLVADPSHREHIEVWPQGRTNHYWFDLNRDWLLLAQPESRFRLKQFHRWKPHVLTDVHEMRTDSTYFFQPGVPSRQNPLTPSINFDLTANIAKYHAEYLDRAGSLYYTRESFDDFYCGKGSTYPDLNGGIGILFEQASSRGHLQENSFGLLSFPQTIRHQVLTSLSTLEACQSTGEEIREYRRKFFEEGLAEAARRKVRGYVIGTPHDRARLFHFVDILLRHQVRVYPLTQVMLKDGKRFSPGSAYVVPLEQPQYRLVRSIFERSTVFTDTTFYDVSTWTLPLSFGLSHAVLTLDDSVDELTGSKAISQAKWPEGNLRTSTSPYAYLFSWDGYYAPRAAYRLLDRGVKLRVATRPFVIDFEDGPRTYPRGTIVVPIGIQSSSVDDLAALMKTVARVDGLDVDTVDSGLTMRGVDLGSPSVVAVPQPKPLMVVGSGVSAYEAGEVWHLLDERYEMRLSMVDLTALDGVDLQRYSHVILVSGTYKDIQDSTVDRVREWVKRGGVLVALRGSVRWAEERIVERSREPDSPLRVGQGERRAYGDYEKIRAQQLISGAIFEAELDRTHPLAFGYRVDRIPVFRNSTIFMKPDENPYSTAVRYTDSPLLSGYVSEENLARLRSTAVVCANKVGEGAVVCSVDNLNFRGAWYGTNKLFANALFFGGVLKSTHRDGSSR